MAAIFISDLFNGWSVMNEQSRLEKNARIKASITATKARHKHMVCKTYELKVDLSRTSNYTKDRLRRLFLEAKWFYNYIVTKRLIFDPNAWKLTQVEVKTKNKTFENRNLNVLSSQMKQELVARAKDAISGLSVQKKKGRKVGALKPKKRVGSIPLIQYEHTFDIVGDRIKVANINQLLKVRGLGQIPVTRSSEVASALLISAKDGNYFVHVAVYQTTLKTPTPSGGIGCDAGIKTQMVLANAWDGVGVQIKEGVRVTQKVRRLHRKFSSRTPKSRGRKAVQKRLNSEYRHITNSRRDIRNKLTSRISGIPSMFGTIATQKDHIAGWQKMWGTSVQTSAIGGMMTALKSKAYTPIVADRWIPMTQTCPNCKELNPEVRGFKNLSNRTFECQKCGFRTDRDVAGAMNCSLLIPLAERKPVDMKASYTSMVEYFNSIPHVVASLMEIPTLDTRGKETEGRQASIGSHPALAGGL